MEVREFEALSMAEAIKAVKKNMGNDAVILETKQQKVENSGVTIYKVKAGSTSSQIPAAGEQKSQILDASLEILNNKISSLDHQFSKIREKMVTFDQFDMLHNNMMEPKTLISREVFFPSQKKIKPAYQDIYKTLQISGLSYDYVEKIIDFLSEKIPEETENIKEKLLPEAIKQIMKMTKIWKMYSSEKGKVKIHTFVGPSGSGKSSFIMRLADYLVQKNSKVSIISYSNQTIGHDEKLKIFSKIINTSFHTAKDLGSLNNIILNSKNVDYILIDTESKSLKNSLDAKYLKDLSEFDIPMEFHPALSLAEKQSQQERAISAFKSVGITSLAFSKFDISWNCGEILHLSHKSGIPLSFFSSGTQIPGQFEFATKERVVERILHLK